MFEKIVPIPIISTTNNQDPIPIFDQVANPKPHDNVEQPLMGNLEPQDNVEKLLIHDEDIIPDVKTQQH